MTRFLDVGSIEQIIYNTAVEHLLTFGKPVQQITAVEMAVLAKQCETLINRRDGRHLMKQIVAELAKAKLLGLIPDCDAVRFTLPVPKLSLGELKKILLKFDSMERRLIVVALAADMSLTEVALLQQKEMKKVANINKWTSELRRFVSATPAHIRCPYIFWELDRNNVPAAMVGFEAKFKAVTKASWSVFASLCDDLIPMDTHEDSKEFATMFVLEAANI